MRQQHGERGLGQPKSAASSSPSTVGLGATALRHGHPARRRDYELFERRAWQPRETHEQRREPVDRLGQLDGIGLDDEHGGSAF